MHRCVHNLIVFSIRFPNGGADCGADPLYPHHDPHRYPHTMFVLIINFPKYGADHGADPLDLHRDLHLYLHNMCVLLILCPSCGADHGADLMLFGSVGDQFRVFWVRRGSYECQNALCLKIKVQNKLFGNYVFFLIV